jgi:anti-anti-sigma factor
MSDVRQPTGLEVVPLDSGDGVRLVGEFDLAAVREFDDAIGRLNANSRITVDLSELTFIDSTGIHALVKLTHDENGGREVILEKPSDSIRRVLEILDLHQHSSFTIR